MRWQKYVIPIKIFCMVFNLSIVVETISHLDFQSKISIQYVAVSPLTETLFCIIQTLRLHIVLMLLFLSYQSHFLHRESVRNMIYCLDVSELCRLSQTKYHGAHC